MVKRGITNSKKLVTLTAVSGALGAAAFNSSTLKANADTVSNLTTAQSSGQASSTTDKKQQATAEVNKAQTDYSQAQSETLSAKSTVESASSAQTDAQAKVDQASSSVKDAQTITDTAKANESSAENIQSKAQDIATAANTKGAVTEQQENVSQAHAQTRADSQAVSDAQTQADSQAAKVAAISSSVADASSTVTKAQQNVTDKQNDLNNKQNLDVTKAQQDVNTAQTKVDDIQAKVNEQTSAQSTLNQKVTNAQKAKDTADANLNDHNQKVTDATNNVTKAKIAVTNDQTNMKDTQKQLNETNAKLNTQTSKQTLDVPSDLASKVNEYKSTGKYANSQEDTDAYNSNKYVASDQDNVKFDASVPMSEADRDYYNLFALDLINQARVKNGLAPLVASQLARDFAHQVSDNYTAEKYDFAHDVGMLNKTSSQMNVDWVGENISWSSTYDFLNNMQDAFPLGYTVNDFKRDIYTAINGMLLDDASSDYGHAFNFLNPDAYSYGFSYRIGNDGNLILNFDGILNQSTVITDPTEALKDQVSQLQIKLSGQTKTLQSDQDKLTAAQNVLAQLQKDNVQATVDAATSALNDAKRASSSNQALLAQSQVQLLSAKNELAQAQAVLADAMKSQQEKQAEIDAAKDSLEAAKRTLNSAQTVFAQRQSDLSVAKSKLAVLQANVAKLAAKVSLDRKAEAAAQTKLNNYLNADQNLADANGKLAQAQKAVETAQTALTQAKSQLMDAQTALTQAKGNTATAQKAYDDALANEQAKKTAFTNAQSALNKIVAQEKTEQAVKEAEQKAKEADAKKAQNSNQAITGKPAQNVIPRPTTNNVKNSNQIVAPELVNVPKSDLTINSSNKKVQAFVQTLKKRGYSDEAIEQVLKSNAEVTVPEKDSSNVVETGFETQTRANNVKSTEYRRSNNAPKGTLKLKKQSIYPQTGEATTPFIKLLGLLISVASMGLIFRSRKAKHFM
ncbi:SEC10/PgrA surface exclusion domain-containing protein [Liquorilactobacillus capillatus]|uniref:Gram-positive cocci surface proteins LPxTG domain-containing protein n=1 Tax=Liquorilactobacillus capillatus DSM 19910 TaxID=1423731 RepID=A0A0R1LYL6_9LACO|nr:SEC10/PgrA surface exclusion domain-containing protein [Liquorilactobacillus capillatus]KRL00513.1 hypothetical protein FC81_GL002045 [Liquorilactobacillus capillatus DSM 19910]